MTLGKSQTKQSEVTKPNTFKLIEEQTNKQCHLALKKARASEELNTESVGFHKTTELQLVTEV